MHLVLNSLHRNTTKDTCGLDSLCRTRFAMAGKETLLENLVQRMLDAGKTLGWVVVLVVNVDVVLLNCLLHIVRKHAFVDIRLGRLGSELHHHAGRSVCIHVGILAGDLGSLSVDDLLEDFA